jgi:hypothetical protein
MFACLFCLKTFSNKGGLATHQPYCGSNPSKIKKINSPNAHAKKGSIPWNKGLTKETDTRIKSRPDLLGKKFAASLNGHTEETKKRLSAIAKDRKLGGYVEGSGRGKKGWYKGFFCDSSWELAYVIYCLDHNIDIKRNKEKRQYEFNGVIKNYIPDFVVNGQLVEIKGYKTEQWLAKHKYNTDVKVLYESDLTDIIRYVIDKYGKNYISLYEGR